MHWTRLTVGLWILAGALWGSTFAAALMVHDGGHVDGWVFVMTRPVFTAAAATLSIGLIAWQLSRPIAEVGIMYTLGYRHGVRSVIGVADDDDGGTVSSIHSRR